MPFSPFTFPNCFSQLLSWNIKLMSTYDKVLKSLVDDMLFNSSTRYGRPDDTRKKDVWPIRVLAFGTRAREHPIMGLAVRAVLFPGPRFGSENWIHWYRFLRGFCFAIANHVPINRALNYDMQVLELNVSPLQGEEFATPQPGDGVQEHHQAKTRIKL